MTKRAGASRTARRMGRKGREARRNAAEQYRQTHGVPGTKRAADRLLKGLSPRRPIHNPRPVEIDEDTLADFSTWTRDELRKAAAEKGIEGRGRMSKDELVKAVTAAYA